MNYNASNSKYCTSYQFVEELEKVQHTCKNGWQKLIAIILMALREKFVDIELAVHPYAQLYVFLMRKMGLKYSN